MRVAIVSTSDGNPGSFGAAYRLHTGLRSAGVDSRMLVAEKTRDDPQVLATQSGTGKLWWRIAKNAEKWPCRFTSTAYRQLSPAWLPENTADRLNALHPDVTNLHWVNGGFLRPESLRRIRSPIVWTLHDMWPMAGAEHYVGDSRRYRDGYAQGNRMPGESGWDINRWVWQRKRRAYERVEDLTIVTPSRWLAECARSSVLFRNRRVEVIPNGLDVQRFQPQDHSIARRILGLPQDKKLVLFGAVSATSDHRKGFDLLCQALQQISGTSAVNDMELVVFGSSRGPGQEQFGVQTRYLGAMRDEISIALVYAAVDVFVAPSREDNLPNTVLEALSCGTPVVAFNIGGMPDMIRHQQNGYLAEAFQIEDLARGIGWVLEDGGRWQGLAKSARDTVLGNFTLEHQARRYRDLYMELANA